MLFHEHFVTAMVHRTVIVTNNGIYAVPDLAACCEVVDWFMGSSHIPRSVE
jgi:hypothetical protein